MDQAEPQPRPGRPERPRPPWPPRRNRAQPAQHQPGGHLPAQPEPGPPGPQPGPGDTEPAQPGDLYPAGLEDCAGKLAAAQPLTEADHPVVVGYDGSAPSRNALAYAAGLARRLGRTLLVAYITTPALFCEPLTGQVIAPVRDSRETHRWLLAELDEVCDRTGLDVCIVTRQGSPARELAAAADEFHADALVIGAPGHVWHHLAGSVPGWLARHAHCPVIVVP
ncbi:MAG: universal stress protein [Streptosporangiaceae bacterium]